MFLRRAATRCPMEMQRVKTIVVTRTIIRWIRNCVLDLFEFVNSRFAARSSSICWGCSMLILSGRAASVCKFVCFFPCARTQVNFTRWTQSKLKSRAAALGKIQNERKEKLIIMCGLWNCSQIHWILGWIYFLMFTLFFRQPNSVVLHSARAFHGCGTFAYSIRRAAACSNRIPVWQFKMHMRNFIISSGLCRVHSALCIVLFSHTLFSCIWMFVLRLASLRSSAMHYGRQWLVGVHFAWVTCHACHAVIRSNA